MEKTIEIEGTRVRYDVEGSGPQPVIVMHGWGCTARTMALPAEAALGADTTVYNLDLPGFGGSPEPPALASSPNSQNSLNSHLAQEVWGVDRYTKLIEAFARELGITKPVLIGHSFGGRIAILYASRNAVEKVILIDAAGIKPRRSLKYYVKVYTFKLAKKLLPLLFGRKRGQSMIDRWRGKAGSTDYKNASPMMRAIMSRVVNEDLTDRLPLIKAPTLLIWGEKDTATPMRDARTMERLIPDAGLVSYPEAGHFSYLDRPAQTTAVIKSFLGL